MGVEPLQHAAAPEPPARRRSPARSALRVLLILLAFATVGLLADRLITARALAHGTPEYAVRLAAAMTGLFAGGIAASLLTLALLLRRPRPAPAPTPPPAAAQPSPAAPTGLPHITRPAVAIVVQQFLDDTLDVKAFLDRFMDLSLPVHHNGDSDALALYRAVDASIADVFDGRVTYEQHRQRLHQLLATPPVASPRPPLR